MLSLIHGFISIREDEIKQLEQQQQLRKLQSDTSLNIFISCNSGITTMSDLPADFQALSETEIYQGSNVDKYYDSACSSLDNSYIDVYFVIKNGEFEYCYMPYIQIKNDCSSYYPEITINTVTVDGDNYWIGYEYAYYDDSSFYIEGVYSVYMYNLYFQMGSYAGNYLSVKNSEYAYISYVVFETIDLNYAVCQLRYVTQVNIDNMQLLDSYNNDYYGILAIYNSNLVTISNLLADNNYSEYGGAIYYENVYNVYISSSQFSNNQAYYEGGAFQVYADYSIGTIQITDSTFDNNQAYKGGAIFARYGSDLIIKDCSFTDNYGEKDGGGVYSYYNDYLTVENISCIGNSADEDGGCFYSENDIYINVQGSQCEQNQGKYGSCHYFQEFSDIYMFDITATLEIVNGGSLYFYDGYGPVEIYQAQIDQVDGNSGAAIGVEYHPYDVKIEDSTFQFNSADYNGGAVKCKEINNLTVKNCDFTSNTSLQSGGGLAVTGANYVYLYDTTFDSCYGDYGGGAMIEELVFLYLNNIKFVDNTATSSAGGLYLEEVDYFEIYGDTQFTGNVCQYSGGGIYLSTITYNIILNSLLFDNNEGSSGGAMYMNSYYTVTIQDSTFSNNAAEYGGVFYLYNHKANEYVIINNNIFDQNQAQFSGGVIYYENAVNNYQSILSTYNSYSQNTGAFALYYINVIYYVDFSFDQFYSNSFSSHGIIKVDSCDYIYVNDNHFEDNTGQYGSSLYTSSNYELRMNRNVFIDNYGTYGGAIYDSSSYSYIQDNTFQTSGAFQANSGQSACIYAEGYNVNSNFIVENSFFQNNVANTLSTAIYLDSVYNVQINDLELDQNVNNGITVSSLKGGSIYLSLDYLSGLIADPVFIIENIYIHDNQGDSSGGIYIQGAKNCHGCLIYNVTYENCISDIQNELQNIFMIYQSNYIELNDIKFLQVTENHALNIQNSGDIVVSNIYVEDYKSNFNSIIRIQASKIINLSDSQFYNIKSKYEPVIYLQNSDDLIFSALTFLNCINEQGEGGGIYGTSLQTIQISQVQMEKMQSTQGSCIYIEQSEYVELRDSVFTENTASISSPGFFFSEGSHYNLQNCLISNNIANSEVGAITINKITNITFSDSQITGNDGGQEVGGLTVDNSDDVKFINLKIEHNFSAKQAGGLRFQYVENVQINDCHINNNKISSNKGGGILIIYGENINVDNSEINYNEGDYGAGIYIQQSKNIAVNGSDLLNNTAKYSGGAIYVADTEDSYYDNLNIKYNQATSEDGGGIYIDQISEYVEIQNSYIEENYANNNGGGIFVGYLTDLIIKKVEVNSNEAEENGSGLYLKQLGKAQISQSSFQNNFGSVSGGALYSINTQEIEMTDSNFKNNEASIQGGAVYVSEQQTLTIEKTQMSGNKIIINKNSKTLIEDQNQSFGGSIYADQIVNFSFINSLIKDSYSYFKGGGIFVTNVNNLVLQDSEIQQATVEAHIKYDLKEKTQDYLLSKGGGFYYEFNLEEDEVDSTEVKIKLKNMVFEKCVASSGGGMLIKQNPDQDFNYSISNLKFEGNEADIGAGARFLGNFKTNFQDKVEGTSQASNNKGYLNDKALFYGFFRNERVQSEQDSEFVLCYQGQFLMDGGAISCEPCLENGICEGGYQHIYPQKNYWRSDEDSLDFYYCSSYPDACLGHECEETYKGVLCEDCDLSQNTFKEGVYCVQCDSKQAVVFNQILKMVILIALTLSSVMSLKKKLDEHLLKKILKIFQIVITRENQFSIIMKIFITHNQILSAGSELAEKIPEKLLNYMNFVGNPVDSVSKSLECLFSYENEADQYEILLKGQLLGYSLSILSLLILLAVPVLGFFFKKFSRFQLQPLLISTMLCYFITIQPGALQISLKSLYCRNIGGTLYSAFQSQVLCDSDFFMLKLMPLHIIMIFILIVIIPLIILRKIHKYYCQGTLYHKMRILRSYGLFYIELSENKYYWEFVWMYMKVIVVIIANFYPSQGTDQIIKTSLITCVVVAYAYLIKLQQPYKARSVNNLAIISSFVQALTLILGVCIIQDDVSSWFVVIAFVAILIGNCIFIYHLIMLAFGYQIEQNIHLLLKLPIPCIREKIKRRFEFKKQVQRKIKSLRLSMQNYIKFQIVQDKSEKEIFWFNRKLYKLSKINYILVDYFERETFPQDQQLDIQKEAFKKILKVSKSQSYCNNVEIQRNFIKEKVALKKNLLKKFNQEEFTKFNSEHASKKSIMGRESQFVELMKQIKYANMLFKNFDSQNAIQNVQTQNQLPLQSQQDLMSSKTNLILRQKVQSFKNRRGQNPLFNLQSSKQSANNSISEIDSSRNLTKTQTVKIKNEENKSSEQIQPETEEKNQNNEDDNIELNQNLSSEKNENREENYSISDDKKLYSKNKFDEYVDIENNSQKQDVVSDLNEENCKEISGSEGKIEQIGDEDRNQKIEENEDQDQSQDKNENGNGDEEKKENENEDENQNNDYGKMRKQSQSISLSQIQRQNQPENQHQMFPNIRKPSQSVDNDNKQNQKDPVQLDTSLIKVQSSLSQNYSSKNDLIGENNSKSQISKQGDFYSNLDQNEQSQNNIFQYEPQNYYENSSQDKKRGTEEFFLINNSHNDSVISVDSKNFMQNRVSIRSRNVSVISNQNEQKGNDYNNEGRKTQFGVKQINESNENNPIMEQSVQEYESSSRQKEQNSQEIDTVNIL